MRSDQAIPIKRACAAGLLFLPLLCGVTIALADPDRPSDAHRHGHDHDLARAALERGEILPLAKILERVGGQVPGEILELELEREDGVWVYELKVIAPDGRLLEVLVDAAQGQLLDEQEDD